LVSVERLSLHARDDLVGSLQRLVQLCRFVIAAAAAARYLQLLLAFKQLQHVLG
jgi:hypothetical protein